MDGYGRVHLYAFIQQIFADYLLDAGAGDPIPSLTSTAPALHGTCESAGREFVFLTSWRPGNLDVSSAWTTEEILLS